MLEDDFFFLGADEVPLAGAAAVEGVAGAGEPDELFSCFFFFSPEPEPVAAGERFGATMSYCKFLMFCACLRWTAWNLACERTRGRTRDISGVYGRAQGER